MKLNNADLADLLRCPILRPLAGCEAACEQLAKRVKSEQLRCGADLWKAGQSGRNRDNAAVIRTGSLQIRRDSNETRGVVFRQYGPGEMIGVSIAFEESLGHSATVRAAAESHVFLVPGDLLRGLVREHQAVLVALARHLRDLVIELTDERERREDRSLGRRILVVLDKLASYEIQLQGGSGDKVLLQISQSELGEMVGTTVEGIRRHFKRFDEFYKGKCQGRAINRDRGTRGMKVDLRKIKELLSKYEELGEGI